MKKILLAAALTTFSLTGFAATFTCYRYVNGHPTGTWIRVKADSKSEANAKAYARMKELGGRVDYAKCRY